MTALLHMPLVPPSERFIQLQLPHNVKQYIERLGELPEVQEGLSRQRRASEAGEASSSGRSGDEARQRQEIRPIPG